MKGFRGRSVETHLIAMKAAGQPEIFMFICNICDHIFYVTCVKQGFSIYHTTPPPPPP